MGNLKIRNKLLRFLDRRVVIWIRRLVSIRNTALNTHLFNRDTMIHILTLSSRCINHFLISLFQTKTTLLAHHADFIYTFIIFIFFFNVNCLLFVFFVFNGNLDLILLIRVRKIINNHKINTIILILLFRQHYISVFLIRNRCCSVQDFILHVISELPHFSD